MRETPIARKVLERVRGQASKVAHLAAFREANAYAEALQVTLTAPETPKGMHPAYAIYAHAQDQMSVMAEQLLELPEMKACAKIIDEAHDNYMPSWPPMSPISTSFFWCWAYFDASVNAHRETLGSVTVAVAAEFGVHPKMLTLMRKLNDSRMGIYRVEGHSGSCVQLNDLVTNQRCLSIRKSGYAGNAGELWFTRVLPPALIGQSDHVVFTSPYVLIAPDERAWSQYFDRIAAEDPKRPRIEALERHLKWGSSRRYWTEFVFEGYVNHQPGAIFLKGLPDVPESRPHSREYVRHAEGQ
ncbi:MAG: hypothetical protein ACLPV8_16815 [Steroidobacteraceae bacterium]